MSPELVHPDLTLDFELLERYAETLKEPLRRALNSGRVDLAPPPTNGQENDPLQRAASKGRAVFDERGGRLVVPLAERGRTLALLIIGGVTAEQLTPAAAPYLAALVETSLDLVRLRLSAETDPVTGLANEATLDEALVHALGRLSPAQTVSRPALDAGEDEAGLALLACAPQGFTGLVDRYGRRLGDRLLLALARKLRGLGPAVLRTGRVGQALVLVLKGGPAVVREMAGHLRRLARELDLTTPQGEPLAVRLHLGAAILEPQLWEAGGVAVEAAAVLKARALRALDCATRLEGEQPLLFNEIADRAGHVLDILPLDRVRLDLGRVHGLSEGERFAVLAPAGGRQGQTAIKAELRVVSLGESDAVAEVLALGDPTWGIRPGDPLRRLGQEPGQGLEAGLERTILVAGRELRLGLDEASGLANHRSFMNLFGLMSAQDGPLCAVLARVEGLEGLREVAGREASEALLVALARAARGVWPNPDWLGRYAPDTLVGLLPGAAPERAADLARKIIEITAAQIGRPLRAGVAFHPCPGFTSADLLANAAKALVHAGFLEPGAVVVFDALSLNVSGDALFAQGRLHEAVAEYERGLLLSPEEPNLLNSLGVCQGHLGQTDKALTSFQRALAVAPDDYMAHFNLGFAQMEQGQLESAGRHLAKSLELSPDNPDVLFQLGRLAQTQGRLAEAADFFARAAALPGCRRAVHRHLAQVLISAGRAAEAEEPYKQALKVNPHDAAALSGLAGLYLDRGANREIALSLARRAHDLEPQEGRHLRVLAQALAENGQAEEAARVLSAAGVEQMRDPFWHLQLGQVEARLGNLSAAREHLRRALELEPNLEAARRALADLGSD